MRLFRRGSVMILALILVAVTTIIVGAMGKYYAHTYKMAAGYSERTKAMAAGQYQLDYEVVARIERALKSLNATDSQDLAQTIKSRLSGFSASGADANGALYGKTVTSGDYTVKMSISGIDRLNGLNGGVLTVTTVVKDRHGGILATITQDITIGGGDSWNQKQQDESHPIFDYGYFIDGNAYLKGGETSFLSNYRSWIAVNGSAGASGFLRLKGANINGYIKSNPTVDPTIYSPMPKILPRACYDTRTTDGYTPCDSGSRVRPTNPLNAKNASNVKYAGGYEVPDNIEATTSPENLKRAHKTSSGYIIQEIEKNMQLPLFEQKDLYRNYCKSKGGTLTCKNQKNGRIYVEYSGREVIAQTFIKQWRKKDGTGLKTYTPPDLVGPAYRARTLGDGYTSANWDTSDLRTSVKKFKRYLSAVSVTGGYWQGQPFDEYGTSMDDRGRAIEKNSLILIGGDTGEKAIKINGPVYVDGDVIIKGYVKGRGAIYAGRNIHIVGNIQYANPPKWPHSTSVATNNNANCDMLGLYAAGSIVIGNYTKTAWRNAANDYLSGFPEHTVGGKSFGGDYTVSDGGQKVIMDYPTLDQIFSTGTDLASLYSSTIYEKEWKSSGVVGRALYKKYKVQPCTAEGDRMYYETLFGDTVVSDWNTTGLADDDIYIIDAALSASHGILGVFGYRKTGKAYAEAVINGAMSCRDDGIIPCFINRFVLPPFFWINWDPRFKAGTAEGDQKVGVFPEIPRLYNYSMRLSGWQAN